MNRPRVIAASLVALILASSPVLAWDPDSDVGPAGPSDGPDWAVTPAPVAPPEGVYLVTETYVDSVVSHNGPLTTYATETVHEVTGSYARVLESVPTGASSGFDGAAFNGRAALTDGRAVAGTYYENYVRTDSGFVAVSIVFFQDDLEIARQAQAAAPTSGPAAAPAPAVQSPMPVAPTIGSVVPIIEALPAPRGADQPGHVARVAPERLADLTIEVLRARRIALSFAYPGATGWRFISGEGVALGPLGGGTAERFVARWDRLAPLGGAWVDRFRIEFADGNALDLVVRVVVRAPGLVE